MAENLGRKLAILRLIPIIVLIVLAFGLDYGLGVDKIWAVGIALVAAIATRLILMRVWR
ncbi:MAG: hypothetical protein AAF926_02100 [Pseudomonadota bacterium]